MSLKSRLFFVVQLVFSIYLGAAVGYIINSLGSTKTDYFIKALSPGILYDQITAGNPVILLFAVLGIVFFILFR